MSKKIVQTAGRDQLGGFAPEFAHYNDDVLFGENWNNPDIDLKTRCIVTLVALMSSGITDSSLVYHLENAKAHGVTRAEAAAIITHAAFYAGWPKGWAVFRLAKEVWKDEDGKKEEQHGGMFGLGQPNDAYAQYTKRRKAADSSCSAPKAGAGIRSGARRHGNCIPAMRWRSLRASNTGMALQRTAGSPIWRWNCPVKTLPMNGWKR